MVRMGGSTIVSKPSEKPQQILTISNKVHFRKLQENQRKRRYTFRPVPKFDSNREYKIHDTLFPNIWKDHRCFIIGGGPSLRDFDFNQLAGELVIGINRAMEKPHISILCSMDIILFGQFESGELGYEVQKKWENFRGIRLWRNKSAGPSFKFTPPDPEHPYVIHTVGAKGSLSWDKLDRLYSAGNSGMLALNLAIVLGANPIYLLGFDMKGKNKKQDWWHSGYGRDQGSNIYKKFIESFHRVAPQIKEHGIDVINLNPDSALQCFPFGSRRKVLGDKPKRPLVISYFTKETGYEKETNRLKLSLHQFGLEYDIEGIESRGSWQANTLYKAQFIYRKMLQHKNRDLLWLDADSVICSYPGIFDDAKFDLGVCKIDWGKYTTHRKDIQLANAVIYLKNTKKVRDFIQEWVEENDKNPQKIEMITMAEVLSRWEEKLNFYDLPDNYCQIFDLMVKAGDPVIEQTQASRRLKVEESDVDTKERTKYDECWMTGYGKSQCALPLVSHVKVRSKKNWKCLDLGCGDGTTVDLLNKNDVNCTGVDITLFGLQKGIAGKYREAPLWRLPFEDNEFDYTFSTDVLEHIPTEKVRDVIKEIYRVTKYRTFHVIAMFPGIRNGVVLHMTLKKIEWWRSQFSRLNRKKIDAKIITRKEFMEGKEVGRPAD